MDSSENGSSSGSSSSSIEELPPMQDRPPPEGAAATIMQRDLPPVPTLFTMAPPVRDALATETSERQDFIMEECLPFLAGTADPRKTIFDFTPYGVPRLEREDHIRYLVNELETPKFLGYDASRPWIVYWALTGLALLGVDVQEYRDRVIGTLRPSQNAQGGFGGGHGQLSHCAPSYAVVLSLAMVGGIDAYEMIDRRAMWRWLGQVKQSDGGFTMCTGGEEDVRGAYCSMVMIYLLSIPLELPPDASARKCGLTTFLDGLPEYLGRCQTFEGGISGAPQTEAHGAYAFCALACLCILGPPHEMIPKYLDLHLLTTWLSARQHAPEGGFSGRTNKLVDGCYSHWVGGCWPLIEAAMTTPQALGCSFQATQPSDDDTSPANLSLYSREGLIRYILSCCQGARGGLRDKPGTRPDAYHSCYTLAGLSSAQNDIVFKHKVNHERTHTLDQPGQWESRRESQDAGNENGEIIFDGEDYLLPFHPIYAIPWPAVNAARAHFTAKSGF